jgi:hypothetical protein
MEMIDLERRVQPSRARARIRRRAVVLTVPVALLALTPAASQAASLHHDGEFANAPGASISLTVTKSGGKLRKVRGIRFADIPVTCSDASQLTIGGEIALPIPVRKSRFGKEGLLQAAGTTDGIVRVAGRLTGGGRRATGALTISFRLATTGASCSTGEQSWSTQRR